MTSRVLRVATHASELARRQGQLVVAKLEENGIACELVAIKTVGDKKVDEPLSGSREQGLFTRELELALIKKKVDCCVHSLKDVPLDLMDGLEVSAQLDRQDPRDVLVVNSVTQADGLASLPAGSRVGTSSPRRRAQLLAMRPDLEAVELRGTVLTRLRKVDRGQVHATILAAASLIRLDATQRITEYLEPPGWLPAPGQGAIAIEIRSDDEELSALLAPLDHAATSAATRAERAFLASLDGAGNVPIGALVTSDMVLHGFVSDVRGRNFVRGSHPVSASSPEKAGEILATELRARGAGSLLAEFRSSGASTESAAGG